MPGALSGQGMNVNAVRRRAIDSIQSRLIELKKEISALLLKEQEEYANMPEFFQYGEKGTSTQCAIGSLACAVTNLDIAESFLAEASY